MLKPLGYVNTEQIRVSTSYTSVLCSTHTPPTFLRVISRLYYLGLRRDLAGLHAYMQERQIRERK